jgi:hypothetical protein
MGCWALSVAGTRDDNGLELEETGCFIGGCVGNGTVAFFVGGGGTVGAGGFAVIGCVCEDRCC